MMKRFLILFTTVLLISWISRDRFFQQVVSNIGRHGYFVSIHVCTPTYRGKIVAENADLYTAWDTDKHIKEADYRKAIIRKLQKDECIHLRKLDTMVLLPVRKVPEVDTVRDANVLIQTYFDHNVLKKGVSKSLHAAIINKLFEWRILCDIDDESGYLTIHR